jgi:hypothetical protein
MRFQILLGLWNSFRAAGYCVDATGAEWDARTPTVLHSQDDTGTGQINDQIDDEGE